MFRKGLDLALSGLALVLFCLPVFAADDSVIITTYYPSPYGTYNQLEVHRSVTYKPLPDSDVVNDNLSEPKIGEMVYTDADKFYHYNGSDWVAQGGGGAVISLKCALIDSACTPASCPSNWTDLGTGCAYTHMDPYAGYYSSHRYVGYCERWCYKE